MLYFACFGLYRESIAAGHMFYHFSRGLKQMEGVSGLPAQLGMRPVCFGFEALRCTAYAKPIRPWSLTPGMGIYFTLRWPGVMRFAWCVLLGFPIGPLKVKLLAGEQKATENRYSSAVLLS